MGPHTFHVSVWDILSLSVTMVKCSCGSSELVSHTHVLRGAPSIRGKTFLIFSGTVALPARMGTASASSAHTVQPKGVVLAQTHMKRTDWESRDFEAITF